MFEENANEPSGGWMPGEKQYIAVVFLSNGTIALQLETSDEPRTTATFFAMTPFVNWTAICGFD